MPFLRAVGELSSKSAMDTPILAAQAPVVSAAVAAKASRRRFIVVFLPRVPERPFIGRGSFPLRGYRIPARSGRPAVTGPGEKSHARTHGSPRVGQSVDTLGEGLEREEAGIAALIKPLHLLGIA